MFGDKERNHRFGILQDEGCSRTLASFLYSKFAAQGSIGVFLARENARKCGERSAKGVDSCFFGLLPLSENNIIGHSNLVYSVREDRERSAKGAAVDGDLI